MKFEVHAPIFANAYDNKIKVKCVRDYFWFGLMLNVPVNNFSVMLGRSHRKRLCSSNSMASIVTEAR